MTPQSADNEILARQIQELIVCPECHGPLTIEKDVIRCAKSDFKGCIRDGVLLLGEISSSFFDNKFEIMRCGHNHHGEWDFCYAEQTRLLEKHLKPGMLVVDVGCGPSLSYRKNGAFVVGLEPSFPSILNNTDVDMKIMGSAAKMPFRNQMLDAIICFYSVHHFVGNTIQETRVLVTSAFREFTRVIKAGGCLFVYEMIPMAPAAALQSIGWNAARKIVGSKLDMHFWPADFFDDLRTNLMPNTVVERIFFPSSLTMVIRPVFSVPQLKVYRFLYPLSPKLFKFVF